MSLQNWTDLIQVAAGGVFLGFALADQIVYLAVISVLLIVFSAYLLQDDIKADRGRAEYIAQFRGQP